MHGQKNIKLSKVCLQNHVLLNYRTDVFKTDINIKLTIRHWWHSYGFINSLPKLLKQKANVKKMTVLSQKEAKES
jgi:hypothetical protein